MDSLLNELAPGIYWMAPDHATDRPVVAAIAGEQATLMVEAGSSAKHARRFLDALATKRVPPLRYVVLPHSHWDHVFGASEIDAVAIATEETRQRVATMATYAWNDAALDDRVAAGLEIPFCRDMIKAELSTAERAGLILRVPEIAFREELAIDLGNRTVHLVHVGGDHASDSCIVVVPGVAAFLSDCLYQNLHVEPNYLTRRRLFPLLGRLLALDVDYYVLGHDDEPLSRAEFESRAHALRMAGELVGRYQLDDRAIQDGLVDAGVDVDVHAVESFVRAFQAGLEHETV
ncbi:MAG: MBL fold metallo-hydrolase [Planctomycetota bacterium]|jgi:glyoxylase-like metal-dependent hydrolase (beta-lactamase superfamily II)